MYVSPISSRFWFGRLTPAMRAKLVVLLVVMVDARVVHTKRCKDAGSVRAGWHGRDRGRRSATRVGEPGAADGCEEGHQLALPLLVTGIGADDHGRAVPLDHAAALAHGLD